jgi:hypothetical protein
MQMTPTMRALQELNDNKDSTIAKHSPAYSTSNKTPPRKLSAGSRFENGQNKEEKRTIVGGSGQAQSRAFKMLQSKLDAGEGIYLHVSSNLTYPLICLVMYVLLFNAQVHAVVVSPTVIYE